MIACTIDYVDILINSHKFKRKLISHKFKADASGGSLNHWDNAFPFGNRGCGSRERGGGSWDHQLFEERPEHVISEQIKLHGGLI